MVKTGKLKNNEPKRRSKLDRAKKFKFENQGGRAAYFFYYKEENMEDIICDQCGNHEMEFHSWRSLGMLVYCTRCGHVEAESIDTLGWKSPGDAIFTTEPNS
jgi:hypothetical protein